MKPQVVGKVIATRRQKLKRSMRAAAVRGGVSATTWSDLEKGKRPLTLAMQRAVADALEWRIDWLDVLTEDPDVDLAELIVQDATVHPAVVTASANVPTTDLAAVLAELATFKRAVLQGQERLSKEIGAASSQRGTQLEKAVIASERIADELAALKEQVSKLQVVPRPRPTARKDTAHQGPSSSPRKRR